MEISTQITNDIQVATLSGDIDANTAPIVTEKILPLVEAHSKILLDMSQVAYMSSAGLRMLLSLYRQATAQERQLVLVGLSEDVQDTMSVTGFLDFFKVAGSLEEGMQLIA
ncbi:MAG: STAS domain-containing protein [Synechocystis sp.]|nr:STAS domain-containing protein [Synechocystis sp.]